MDWRINVSPFLLGPGQNGSVFFYAFSSKIAQKAIYMNSAMRYTIGVKIKEIKEMKQYGFNKATEFSKKQIGVIYAKAKSGQLQIERWYMSHMYDLADYYGYDSNRDVEREEQSIKRILEAVFAGNLEEAQERITRETEHQFGLYTEKAQKSMSRELVA